ncbi:MAG: arsenite methyltransferase [Saprospiraceae bacterium]|nr:arsenite methyltransferase [Saprospiraceae bacterium]
MKSSEELKALVREKYSEIALQSREQNQSSCCGSGGCSTVDYSVFSDDYSRLQGYVPEADLGLGCGLPTEFAHIREGDTVVDLGSGAGNDCFVARSLTGPEGRVIGIDMTEAMITQARANAARLGFGNVEFRQGDIENMPVGGNQADVVVSNCVLNLVPDKKQAFSEIFRILKPGGHFSISDVVLEGALPEGLQEAAEMYAGCVSGAIQKSDYLEIIRKQGFAEVTVQKEKRIELPDDILEAYLPEDQLSAFRASGTGIYSMTVFARKPATAVCCGTGCC